MTSLANNFQKPAHCLPVVVGFARTEMRRAFLFASSFLFSWCALKNFLPKKSLHTVTKIL